MSSYHSMEPISLECTDALDDSGYVLALATTGKVAKCAAGGKALGVNEASTKNYVTDVAEANKQVAVVQRPRYAMVQYDVRSGSEDWVIGELLSVKGANAAGKVKLHVATVLSATPTKSELDAQQGEVGMIVGRAMEAHTWASGTETGKVKVMLLCPMTGDV